MFDIQKIFTWIKTHFTKKELCYLILILGIFFITRLLFINEFPIFTDEGIYIHWSKIAWKDATWRFISLTDGRQPLQTWATIPFLKIFQPNYLLAGRMFSVFGGLFGVIGFFLMVWHFISKKAAYWGTMLYILCPYFLFYDRLALADSITNSFFIWISFLGLLLFTYHRYDMAFLLGLVSGFGMLAKSSVKLAVIMLFIQPILIIFNRKKYTIFSIINFMLLLCFSLVLAILIYNVQRLSPFFHYVSLKNTTFIMTLSEFISNPFSVFFRNYIAIPQYIFWEMGFIFPILGIIGMFLSFKQKKHEYIYLSFFIIFSYIILTFVSKILFPRYVLFIGSILAFFAIVYIHNLQHKVLKTSLVITVLCFFIIMDFMIIFKPANAFLPPIDRGQYIEGVTAGWGVDDIMMFARSKSKEKPVVLVAEGNFGLIADMLEVFIKPNDKISVKGYWPLSVESLYENQKLLKDNYVYVVFPHRTEFPEDWPMRLIKRYTKPNNKSSFYLFELIK